MLSSTRVFGEYLERWDLTADGESIVTRGSVLLPVRAGETPAMLKIAALAEERAGGDLMTWWDGGGAARILTHEGNALLMERAGNHVSLSQLARSGHDDEATQIVCGVAAKLHAARAQPPPTLTPLDRWFASLEPAAATHGGDLRASADVAAGLLAAPRNRTVLHGDLHHGNVLDFGERGWLAIDPKGLVGERGFDYANIFCNPDFETASRPGRLARQVEVIAAASGVESRRLLAWAVAWTGLSAAFLLEDGLPVTGALRLLELALTEYRA